MQTLIIFWSSWCLELVITECQQDPPRCPLLVPSKAGQIRLLIRKSLWVLPACYVSVYSKDIHLWIWISWLWYICLSAILVHGASSLLLVLSCWELEWPIEQYLLIHRSAIHLEIFLKRFFRNHGWVPQMIFLDHSTLWYPYQGSSCLLSLPYYR